MSDDSADGFLARWSRRKRAAARTPEQAAPEETAVAPAAIAANLPAVGPEPVPAVAEGAPVAVIAGDAPPAEPPAFDPASLPSPESLTADSDITGFLRAEVPAALRRAALRRFWTLDPSIRDFIGPADYAWDYNAPDGVPGFSLGLGGDVQKLLAQAMGWQPEAAADAGAVPVMPPEPAPAAIATLPALDSPADPGTVTERPEFSTAAVELPAPPAARRHGGARPD